MTAEHPIDVCTARLVVISTQCIYQLYCLARPARPLDVWTQLDLFTSSRWIYNFQTSAHTKCSFSGANWQISQETYNIYILYRHRLYVPLHSTWICTSVYKLVINCWQHEPRHFGQVQPIHFGTVTYCLTGWISRPGPQMARPVHTTSIQGNLGDANNYDLGVIITHFGPSLRHYA